MSKPKQNPATAPDTAIHKIERGDDVAQGRDLAAENRARLAALFPGLLTEAVADDGSTIPAIDADALRDLVGATVESDSSGGREKFGLSWHGKAAARRLALTPSTGALRPCPGDDESVDWDTTKNVVIEGDNLEVLKLLQKSYAGQVKLIYIDPPYNTGKDFVYKDNFRDPLGQYERYTGQRGEDGEALVNKENRDSGGRFHTDWLNMIYPRLLLARELLREDGVIAISIDDEEQQRLRSVCDELFGEENFVATIMWQKRYVSNVTAKYFSDMHDFVHIYARNIAHIEVADWDRTEEQLKAYKNPDNDPRGIWRAQDLSASKVYKAGTFTITGPTGETFSPPPNRYWRCNEEQFQKWKEENRIWWGVNKDARPMLKAFLSESERGLKPHTWWSYSFAGHNKEATLEVKELFDGNAPFDTPKPVKLLSRLLDSFHDGNSIILDFFAGSGTTGHAVMAQNAADGGDRRYVLVQLPEPISGAGRDDYPTIAELTKERLRRAGRKIREEHEGKLAAATSGGLDTGFRVFKLDTANVKAWEAPTTDALEPGQIETLLQENVDGVKLDRTDEDLLWGAMLNLGLPLDGRVQTHEIDTPGGGMTVYVAGAGTLLACFAKSIDRDAGEALAGGLANLIKEAEVEGDVTVLLRDSAFGTGSGGGDDAVKVNLVENLRQHAPDPDKVRVLSI